MIFVVHLHEFAPPIIKKVDDVHLSRSALVARSVVISGAALFLSLEPTLMNICPRRPAKIDSSLLLRRRNGKRTLSFLSQPLFFLKCVAEDRIPVAREKKTNGFEFKAHRAEWKRRRTFSFEDKK